MCFQQHPIVDTDLHLQILNTKIKMRQTWRCGEFVLPTDINNLLNECSWEPWGMNYNATFALNRFVKQILAFSFKKFPSHKKFCCDAEILNSSTWIHFPIVNNMIYMSLPCFKLLLIHAMFTLHMWHNLLYGTPLF